ncbi:hypothetical protein [Bosea sp. BK604]|uniref:hypothetical protein n=1 Tax=Bosea sp. BK604 TaxID=2512180 RepID=UPI00104D85BA|nr:hypothetical protein [Bosea sp. BK604]TCR60557.1 hypothetical protein EV560_11644 [Bosea sp. BK604]
MTKTSWVAQGDKIERNVDRRMDDLRSAIFASRRGRAFTVRYRAHLLILAILTLGIAAVTFIIGINSGLSSAVTQISLSSLISSQSNPSSLRTMEADREIYAALNLIDKHGESAWKSDKTALARTVSTLDKNMRQTLSDLSLKYTSIDHKNLEDADCATSQSETPRISGRPNSPGAGGQNFSIREVATVSTPATTPGTHPMGKMEGAQSGRRQWIPYADDRAIEQANLGLPSSYSGLLCLSGDARWLLAWENEWSQPFLMHLRWIRAKDEKWHVLVDGDLRNIKNLPSSETWKNRNKEVFDALTESVKSGNVRFYNNKDTAGFAFSDKSRSEAGLVKKTDSFYFLLWTSTGLINPRAAMGETNENIISLIENSKPDTSVDSCQQGEPHSVDGGRAKKHVYKCDYKQKTPVKFGSILLEEHISIESWRDDETNLYDNVVFISSENNNLSIDNSRVSIAFRSHKLTRATIYEGDLYVREENGDVWRYIVDRDRFKDLLNARWIGRQRESARRTEWSVDCKRLECDKVPVPDFPATLSNNNGE